MPEAFAARSWRTAYCVVPGRRVSRKRAASPFVPCPPPVLNRGVDKGERLLFDVPPDAGVPIAGHNDVMGAVEHRGGVYPPIVQPGRRIVRRPCRAIASPARAL